MKNHRSIAILIIFIGFQGISGLFGGVALLIDPTGELLQMPLSMLEGTPFENFLVPGIILLTILGIFPTVVLYGVWKRLSWAWAGAFMLSTALIIWIGVEIWLVGYQSEPPLQLIYGLLGVVLLILTLLPAVRHELNDKLK